MVYWVNVWDMSDWGMIHYTVCLWCCCVSGATYTMLWVTGGLTVQCVCGVAVFQEVHTEHG